MTASEQEKSVLGQVIAGKYRIESVLGTGGMGVVLAATHLDLGRMVAVKLMRSELADHPWAVDRLLREAKLAAQFRGEHVCRVLDVGTVTNGAPYIVMEYLEGSDLATLLTQYGSFSVETAVDFMLQASEALAEAHAASIVHRDLKPENLFVAKLLDGTPTIKVLDFGISKQVGALSTGGRVLTNPSAALGSPFYMAPEQMRSARDVDPRADLWAVGTILFELLTGSQAFQGESLPEVCGAVMSNEPPRVSELRPDVPAELADAIARCLEKDPARRFSNVLEMAAAFAPFGSADAGLALERIERVLTRRPNTPSLSTNSSPLLMRPSGVRLTPSGPRQRAPTPSLSESAVARRERSTLTPDMLDAQLRPRRLPWILSIVVLAAAGAALGLWLRRASVTAPTTPADASASALPVRSQQPSSAVAQAAPQPEPSAPLEAPGATPSASEPAPASAQKPGAALRPSLHAARPSTARPHVQATAAAEPAPPAPSRKAPDAAAAWDTNSFGPRH